MRMLSWFVEKDQVDKNFTLQELQEFSRKRNAKVIVKGFCTFNCGVVTWLM